MAATWTVPKRRRSGLKLLGGVAGLAAASRRESGSGEGERDRAGVSVKCKACLDSRERKLAQRERSSTNRGTGAGWQRSRRGMAMQNERRGCTTADGLEIDTL